MYLDQSSTAQSGLIFDRSLTRACSRGCDDLVAIAKGQTLDVASCGGPLSAVDGLHQLGADLFAFTAHDDIDPWGLGQDLFVHEGRMDPAQHPNRGRHPVLSDAQRLFGGIDRRGDCRDTDHIGLQALQFCREGAVIQPVGHGINKVDIGESSLSQMAGQIRHPSRRPCPRDFGPARAVIGVNEQDSHADTSKYVNRELHIEWAF